MSEARGIPSTALIVDDEHDIRELLVLTLGRMGLRTDTAANLAAARPQLASHHYDLCLTDMRLPDGSGIALVAELSAPHPDTPTPLHPPIGTCEPPVGPPQAGALAFVK